MDGSTGRYTAPSTVLREPAAKAFASVDAVHRITFATRIAGQFLEDFLGMRTVRLRSPSLIAEVVDRAAERSRSSTGGILLDGEPFDCAQGSWASEESLGESN